ncbi:hypothetical protein KCP76_15195 [Salmonella enterica subsp. enterica serovar Weltevreden]|nr:hypothetical protein KCP76_15195 [Salmonella enterica subsp. enterica serovar Weltevreden]
MGETCGKAGVLSRRGKPRKRFHHALLTGHTVPEILNSYLFRTLNEVREIADKGLSEYNCERVRYESREQYDAGEYRQ